MSHAYPTTEEAIQAGKTLVTLLRDSIQPEDTTPCVHAAWVVAGAALSVIVGNPDLPPHVIGMSNALSDAGKAEAIESAIGALEADSKGAIPWALILEIAMKIIERFVKK